MHLSFRREVSSKKSSKALLFLPHPVGREQMLCKLMQGIWHVRKIPQTNLSVRRKTGGKSSTHMDALLKSSDREGRPLRFGNGRAVLASGLQRNDVVGGNRETHEAHERNTLIAGLRASFASPFGVRW